VRGLVNNDPGKICRMKKLIPNRWSELKVHIRCLDPVLICAAPKSRWVGPIYQPKCLRLHTSKPSGILISDEFQRSGNYSYVVCYSLIERNQRYPVKTPHHALLVEPHECEVGEFVNRGCHSVVVSRERFKCAHRASEGRQVVSEKRMSGWCATPCSLLSILTAVAVCLLAAASLMHSVALRRLGASVEELRATRTMQQVLPEEPPPLLPRTPESSSNVESSNPGVGNQGGAAIRRASPEPDAARGEGSQAYSGPQTPAPSEEARSNPQSRQAN
jgi:hypothetical protein